MPPQKNIWLGLFKRHWPLLVIFILGVVVIHAFLLCDAFKGEKINAENASQFGSFLAGYIGMPIALMGVLLLIMTLLEQIKKDKDEGFERRFFQLLDYHRGNVEAIGVGEKVGLRTFVTLIREFRMTLDEVDEACAALCKGIPNSERIDLAYMAFYYGTGPNSTRVLRASIAQYDKDIIDFIIIRLEDYDWKKAKMKERNLGYMPFEGHQSRLGHYFRHLYEMVRYIDRNGGERSKEFAGMLRAQLSNHEQALLCLNSLSTIGAAWKNEGLLVKYRMIKNLPENFFDPKVELDVAKIYPEIDFEYKKQTGTKSQPNREQS
jgi:hypothetical protein